MRSPSRYIPLLPSGIVDVFVLLVIAGTAASCTAESKTLPEHESAEAAAAVRFTDVTAAAGLGAFRHENGAVGRKWYPEMMGSGGGFVDYDGDGWLDVILLGGGSWDPDSSRHPRAIWLYRNEGHGTFSDQTRAAGLENVKAYTLGFAAADYDNDGDEDLFVSNLGRDMLFRNDDGVFADVTDGSGVGRHEEWGSSPIFFDADRDGFVDLFVVNYVKWSEETDKWCPSGSPVKMYCIPADYEGIASRYYRNNGDGMFIDRTEDAGFITGERSVRDKALGVVELDYNKDGWPDLYVATDGEGNFLYENRGDGTFMERGVPSGTAFSEHGEARAGMGVATGVVDSTDEASILVGNFSEEPISVYKHLGDGLFQDRTAASKLSQPSFLTLTFGLILFDVDLDGDLDLLAANGHVYPDRLVDQDKITFRQPTQMFLNHGDGTFEEVQRDGSVLSNPMVGRAAAYGDYDRDGDLDVLLTENAGPAHLWRNELRDGTDDNPSEANDRADGSTHAGPPHFLRVRLEGSVSNRDALGARVIAVVDGFRMHRLVATGSSYLSQSEKAAVFGLGKAERVDSLLIFWPSGRSHRLGAVEADQELTIVEEAGVVAAAPLSAASGIVPVAMR